MQINILFLLHISKFFVFTCFKISSLAECIYKEEIKNQVVMHFSCNLTGRHKFNWERVSMFCH